MEKDKIVETKIIGKSYLLVLTEKGLMYKGRVKLDQETGQPQVVWIEVKGTDYLHV